jgi:hypothetical protein
MAFNPFGSFRKYQKFWMAMLVLVAMLTFVLNDLITRLGEFAGGRGGREVATLDGRRVTDTDLYQLREQRNMANDFMRKAADLNYQKLKKDLKDLGGAKISPDRQKKLTLATALIRDLEDVLHRPRYFDGGVTKLDDLLDFLLWKHEADRLGIRLQDAQLKAEIIYGVHAQATGMSRDGNYWYSVYYSLRQDHAQANEKTITEALRQEFRVRIAKMTLLQARPYALLKPDSIHLQRKVDTRLALTPYQMWTYYSRDRAPTDIALLPVDVDRFLAQVKGPDSVQRESLFEQYRKEKYDPASPLPGFEQPAEVKVSWVTADPKSDFYRRLARVMTTLEAAPPVAYTPGWPGLGTAVEYGARAAAWKTSLLHNYENLRKRDERYDDVPLTEPYFALPLYTRLYEKPAPEVVATMVGAALQPGPISAGIYQAAAYQKRAGELEPVLAVEAQRRWPVGATVLLAASPPPYTLFGPSAFQLQALLRTADEEDQYLPYDVVRQELRKQVEHGMAVAWTGQVMKAVRKELEQDRGNGVSLRLRLEELQGKERYQGLEIQHTRRFHNRFDLGASPNLKGFKESFERYRTQINTIEGLAGTDRFLKEDDFYRLFFGSEPFSVGNTSTYDPHIWPPVATVNPKQRLGADGKLPDEDRPKTIDLWATAESPVLFWKTDSHPERIPEPAELAKNEEIRKEVDRAWRIARAREDLALPKARAVAEELKKLQTKEGDYLPTLAKEAENLKTQVVTLSGVTPLIPVVAGKEAAREWKPYELPKGRIPYPLTDMTKDILALRDLKAPIKIAEQKGEGSKKRDVEEVVRRLNKLNEELFNKALNKEEAGQKLDFGRRKLFQVQVLTNRPRTIFYVAAVVKEYEPDLFDFLMAWKAAPGSQIPTRDFFGNISHGDTLVDMTQEQAAQEFEARFLRQLRDQYLKIVDASAFDKGGGG